MPYEPYKAAITPLITAPLKKKNSKGQLVQAEVPANQIENSTCDEIDAKEINDSNEIVVQEETPNESDREMKVLSI